MKKILFIAGLVSTMLLAACSSEESVVKEDGKVNVAKGITFQFTEEEYVPGVVGEEKAGAKGTRAVQSETVDLGNGLVAELSLEPDTMATAKTRAPKPISDGHYTIYAVDASNVRHDGIKGTITSGVFTPDALGEWNLNPGETYTFVCINDAVTDNGTSLRYDFKIPNGMNENPMIGVTTHTVSTAAHDVVSFTMRHQNARVRYQITSYTAPVENGTFRVAGSDAGSGYGVIDYDVKGAVTGHSGGVGAVIPTTPMTADRAISYSPYVETYTATTRYFYYPDAYDFVYMQYSNVQGTLYGKTNPFTASNFTHIHANTTLQKNHSYVFNWKVKSNPLYLYQDGTVGYLGNKGTRTPIGIVVTEKTASDKGLAAALNFIPNVIWEQDNPPAGSGDSYQNNTVCYAGPFTGQNDMNGYNWTWDKASSLDGKVRGDEQTKYPAFYVAGHYNPGVMVTGANVGKWFLPSFGQIVKLIRLVDNSWTFSATDTWWKNWTSATGKTPLTTLKGYLTQAGGDLPNGFISTSTQADGTQNYRKFQPIGLITQADPTFSRISLFTLWKTMGNGGVWAFVNY